MTQDYSKSELWSQVGVDCEAPTDFQTTFGKSELLKNKCILQRNLTFQTSDLFLFLLEMTCPSDPNPAPWLFMNREMMLQILAQPTEAGDWMDSLPQPGSPQAPFMFAYNVLKKD